jgi:hypothetical protein
MERRIGGRWGSLFGRIYAGIEEVRVHMATFSFAICGVAAYVGRVGLLASRNRVAPASAFPNRSLGTRGWAREDMSRLIV